MTSVLNAPAPVASRRRARAVLPVLACIGFLAVLPLEWMTLAGAGGGFIKPFHLAAFAFMAICLARWTPALLLAKVVRRWGAVYLSYALVLAMAFAGGMAFKQPFLSKSLIARQAYYCAMAVFLAGFVVLVLERGAQRLLAWAGAVTTGILLTAFILALARQGSNPISVIADALAQANPDIITYRLLRSTFRSGDDLAEVAANLRHKVFIGLLVGVNAGLAFGAAVPKSRRTARTLLLVSGVLGFALVVMSLSRSTILCLALTLVLIPLRVLVRGRARPGQALVLCLVAAASVGLLLSPVGELLWVRFSASGSYESRLTAAGPSFVEDFLGAALIGTDKTSVDKSPHNFILNAWLSGGVLAGLAALAMLVSIGRAWAREALRYLTGRPGWLLPVEPLWVLGLGVIPLVRSFTAGNQFHMVEWAAIGLFTGIVLANDRARARHEVEAEAVMPAASARP